MVGTMLLAAGCVLCEAPQGPVCASCAARLHRAGPLPQGDPPARALLGYEGVGRELVTCLKYRNGRPLVGPLGRLLAELAVDVDAEVVTWVPASRAGRRHRGFDQGRLLARATARSAGLGVAGTMGAVHFVIDHWKELLTDFDRSPFAICLRFQDVDTDPNAFRKPIEISRFRPE